MKSSISRGFTIIEVMLFLAISGLLVAMLLGGWTLLINTQRYKDSVDTTYGYLQDQYNLVYNVENERSSSLICTSGGIVESGGSTERRGQSDCVLMGRFIKLTGGTTLQSYAVVGREPAAATGDDNDIIKQYNPKVVTQSIGLTEAEQTVPWGAVMRGKAGNKDPLNLSIMLLRSPTSGLVHRYIVSSSQPTPSINLNDITTASEDKDVFFCFDAGAPVQGGGRAVKIGAYASSRNSVETLDGDSSGC